MILSDLAGKTLSRLKALWLHILLTRVSKQNM
jgi:hypothetical protein